MTDQTAPVATDAAAPLPAQFTVEKIYVKDVSFEAPNTPQMFNEQGQPQLGMNINQKVGRLDEAMYEVILGVTLTARHDYPTLLWGRDGAQVAKINQGHENPRYLPGVVLPDSLRATDDLAAAVAAADLLLVVTPSHAFNDTLRALTPHRRENA